MTQPKIIAISGPSGSGKTTCANKLAATFPNQVSIIAQDAYYLDRRDLTAEQRAAINYDHPQSVDQEALLKDLNCLKHGQGTNVPCYDYTTHLRTSHTQRVDPNPIIVVEGITLLAIAGLRELADFHIFLDVPLDICLLRRIKRDRATRDRTTDQILDQYAATVRPMYYEFVHPIIKQADHIIHDQSRESQIVEFFKALSPFTNTLRARHE